MRFVKKRTYNLRSAEVRRLFLVSRKSGIGNKKRPEKEISGRSRQAPKHLPVDANRT
jgi:hypothetical protein